MNKIDDLRKEKKWSYDRLALEMEGATGISTNAPQMSRLAKGQRQLTITWIDRLCVTFQCTRAVLLGDENIKTDMTNPPSLRSAMEIYRQIDLLVPNKSTDEKIDCVYIVYDDLKDKLDIDPSYIRGFFQSKDFSDLL